MWVGRSRDYAVHLLLEFRVSWSLSACFDFCSFDARWESADREFPPNNLRSVFPFVSMLVLMYAVLTRNEVLAVREFPPISLDRGFPNTGRVLAGRECQPNTFGSVLPKLQCTCSYMRLFDTRWELADREFLPTNLDRDFPKCGVRFGRSRISAKYFWISISKSFLRCESVDREFLPTSLDRELPNTRKQIWQIENFCRIILDLYIQKCQCTYFICGFDTRWELADWELLPTSPDR